MEILNFDSIIPGFKILLKKSEIELKMFKMVNRRERHRRNSEGLGVLEVNSARILAS